jgi:phenylalanyl-tRNA synthetase beta chain
VVDGTVVGAVGELDPSTLGAFGIGGVAVAFELELAPLIAGARREQEFVPLSTYPAATMDLAFVLDEAVAAADVLATVRGAGGELVEDAHVFDEFRAETLGEGKRSLAVAIRFRAPDRTLEDKELASVRQACIDAVVKAHGAVLRG